MKRVLNAVGYNRVSTPGQVDNTSLSYQSKVIKNRANADGVNLIKIFSEEGKSGTNTNRPEYRATKNTSKITMLIFSMYTIPADCIEIY